MPDPEGRDPAFLRHRGMTMEIVIVDTGIGERIITTLAAFLAANPEIDPEDARASLAGTGAFSVGGGAAPLYEIRRSEPRTVGAQHPAPGKTEDGSRLFEP